MKLGVRSKLFLIFLLLDLALMAQLGFSLESATEGHLIDQIHAQLVSHAKTARLLFEIAPGDASIPHMDRLADQLGQSIARRVTVISKDGTLLGDSSLALDAIMENTENHADRPEILQAFAQGMGVSKRLSETLHQEMIYQAVSFHRGCQVAVARISMTTAQVQSVVSEQRRALLMAMVFALAMAVLMTALAVAFATRKFRLLVKRASYISKDLSETPIAIDSSDEVGGLADSLNEIAMKLEETVIELAQDRARLHTVLHGMSEGMIALDRNRRITLINKVAKNLLNVSNKAVGHTIERILPAESPKVFSFIDDESSCCAGGFDWVGPSHRLLHIVGTKMPGDSGYILMLRDVTDSRKMDQVQRDLVANVSHELRTPVHVILVNAELLNDHLPNSEPVCQKLAESLESNAQRLSRIITNLLHLSKLDAGQHVMHIDDLFLLPLVQRSLERVTDLARAKSINLSVQVENSVRALLDGEIFSEIILFNLLDNAVKYSPKNARIVVRIRTMGDGLRLEVEDNGLGITVENRQRIFERFYRVDVRRSRDMGGTGLGLSIVKQLAAKMNAEVGVEAVLPHGSIFWVSLPGTSPEVTR